MPRTSAKDEPGLLKVFGPLLFAVRVVVNVVGILVAVSRVRLPRPLQRACFPAVCAMSCSKVDAGMGMQTRMVYTLAYTAFDVVRVSRSGTRSASL